MGVWNGIQRVARIPLATSGKKREIDASVLRRRVNAFLRLLADNGAAHSIIADLEEKASGDYIFDEAYLRQCVHGLEVAVADMIRDLAILSNGRYLEVSEASRRVFAAVRDELDWRPSMETGEFVLPFGSINRAHKYVVGGKNFRLAAMLNEMGLPVPPGFAITARAYLYFLSYHGLGPLIAARLGKIDPTNPGDLVPVSRELQALIREREVPADLRKAIEQGYQMLVDGELGRAHVALRSSALREDGVASFAGQYATALNVPGHRLVEEYREIIASKFSTRAIFYFLNKGFRQEDLAMSVVCQVLVPAVASGVIYSADPINPDGGQMVVNAAWGLGQVIVDGRVQPDVYYLDRETMSVSEARVARKPVEVRLSAAGGTEEVQVPLEKQSIAAVSPEQLRILAEYALRLEEHFGCPQDVEWAIDSTGNVQILQSRTLRVERWRSQFFRELVDVTGRKVLLKGGAVASPGAASGRVALVRGDEDLAQFPPGGVLVAAQPSPDLVVALEKAAAMVCDTGGVASHLATLAREFRVPTLLGTGDATSVLSEGQQVTVDTDRCCVFEGEVREVIDATSRSADGDGLEETELFQLLHRLQQKVVPLHLVDPRKPDFTPANCDSVHDVVRYIHQAAMNEMARLAERLTDLGCSGARLESDIPLSIQVLNLDANSDRGSSGKSLTPDDITSEPLRLFLKGLTECEWPGPRNVSLSGFMSVMAIHASEPHRLAEPCLAVVTDDYMNFSVRTGYHYSTVEALCPRSGFGGYVRLHFRGGGAAVECRGRRERLIREVLQWAGFSVEHRADMINAIAENLNAEEVRSRLRLLAHFTVFTKQLDVLLTSDAVTNWYIEEFKKGSY